MLILNKNNANKIIVTMMFILAAVTLGITYQFVVEQKSQEESQIEVINKLQSQEESQIEVINKLQNQERQQIRIINELEKKEIKQISRLFQSQKSN